MASSRAASVLALGLGLLSGIAGGQDRDAANAALRPSGPVTVTADRAEWEQNGAMIYSGNVALSSDTLKLSGERLELRQHPGGQFEAQVTGNPARLSHPGLQTRGGERGPPVTAAAQTLRYDSRTSVVDIQGQARLTRGQDEVHGEQIRYDAAQRRIRAAGGQGGQVRIVIQPPAERAAPAAGTDTPAPMSSPDPASAP